MAGQLFASWSATRAPPHPLALGAGKQVEVTYVPKAALEQTAALPRTPENAWSIFGAEVSSPVVPWQLHDS